MGMYLLLTLFLFFPLTTFAQNSEHVVKPGDTLFSIARNYGVSLDQVLNINNIKDPRHLRAGQRIVIPQTVAAETRENEVEVEVKPGDTLYSLARRYQISLQDLRLRNGLDESSRIRVGQKLYIPNQINPRTEPTSEKVLDRQTIRLEMLPLESRPTTVNRPVSGLLFRSPGLVFKAAESGRVVYKDVFSGLGNLILVQSDDGLIFGYAGWLSSAINRGDNVKKGDVLGKLARDPPGSLLFFIYDSERIFPPEMYHRGPGGAPR